MPKTPLNHLIDGLAEELNEIPLDENGNPLWVLPECMEDDLSGSDNPLGDVIRGLALEMTTSEA
jgi:hypothetical protein